MFVKIPGTSTLGSYNVHNVLAGSNILIWVCFVGQAVFLDLETQKPQCFGLGRLYCLVKSITQILSLVQCLCALKACNFYFLQVISMPFHAYVLSSPFCYY